LVWQCINVLKLFVAHPRWLKITLDAFQMEGWYIFGQSIIKISIIFTLTIFDLANGKGKEIKNLIYNWLVFVKYIPWRIWPCFIQIFYMFYGILKAMIDWRNIRTIPFYQFLHFYKALDIQWVPLAIGESF
jgi:hypothetical protein